jgi:hypothetical protein
MRKFSLAIIVILLVSIVGYLAIDRQEKNVAHQRDKAFDQKFAK